MEHYEYIETTLGKIIESDLKIGLVAGRMVGEQLFNAVGKRLHLLTRGIVGDLYEKALATRRTKAEILDRRIDHRVVRDRYQRVIRCADPGAPEADVLDCPLAPGDPDQVTNPERLLEHDQHRAQQVCQAVASGERDGQAADAQAGENRIGRETQLVRSLDQ